MNPALIVVGLAILAVIFFFIWLGGGSEAPTVRPPAPIYRPPAPPAATPPPSPVLRSTPASNPVPILPIVSEAKVQEVLRRRVGQEWEREQAKVRAHVLQKEQEIAARLRSVQNEYHFEQLKNLHHQSRQTADHAYRLQGDARRSANALREAIRSTHRAIEADRISTRGLSVPALRHALDDLHADKQTIEGYCLRYKEDLDRLNIQTGYLRDSIGKNCGEPGRRWYEALMQRTIDRREGRL